MTVDASSKMESGSWVEWVGSYVAQHAALAITESVGSQHFQRVLHDVSKPFRELTTCGAPHRELVRQCLEKLDSLDYEIHSVRRFQLSAVTGQETRRSVDLAMLLADIIHNRCSAGGLRISSHRPI